jgi:hypothetical protein
MELTTNFRHQVPELQIVSFFETRTMPGLSGLVGELTLTSVSIFHLLTVLFTIKIVEKSSALLEYPYEQQVPVDANHIDMCKYGSRSNSTYTKVCKRIKRMIKDSGNDGNGGGDDETSTQTSPSAWTFDRARQKHYYYSAEENCWVYEDGTRIEAS